METPFDYPGPMAKLQDHFVKIKSSKIVQSPLVTIQRNQKQSWDLIKNHMPFSWIHKAQFTHLRQPEIGLNI